MVYKIRDLHSLSTIRTLTPSILCLNISSLSLFNLNILLNSPFTPNLKKHHSSTLKRTMKTKISVIP